MLNHCVHWKTILSVDVLLYSVGFFKDNFYSILFINHNNYSNL